MTINLDELEAVARAATPGPWHYRAFPDDDQMHDIRGPINDMHNVVIYAEAERSDAEHIAAFDPPTVLGLIAELRRARECIQEVRAVPNEFEWDVPPTARAILTTYDQEGAS